MNPIRPARLSLRAQLLVGVLLPVLVLLAINSVVLYRQALKAAHQAYDRTLLATAKSLGEQLTLQADDAAPVAVGKLRVLATLPYAALDAFEADHRSRIYYRVAGFEGETVLGHEDLPPWQGRLPERDDHGYAALVHFYDAHYRDAPVRMAVLLQPVASELGQGMATVQVAETLELRQTLARQMLFDTLWREAVLMALIAVIVALVVHRATRPLRQMTQALAMRREDDWSALPPSLVQGAPKELGQVIEAANQWLERLRHLVDEQRRFVRDASHQLRTPLAVLRAQVQSARRGDVDPATALREIERTTDSATRIANQMLALAKIEQLRHEGPAAVIDGSSVLREVALDLAPLIAERDLHFEIHTQSSPVRVHEWALRELLRNLLHNAIKHSPPGAALSVESIVDARHAAFVFDDEGPGLAADVRARLFRPFASGDPRSGSGLGLAICREIVEQHGGSISLEPRESHGRTPGLRAVARLPLAAGMPPVPS